MRPCECGIITRQVIMFAARLFTKERLLKTLQLYALQNIALDFIKNIPPEQ